MSDTTHHPSIGLFGLGRAGTSLYLSCRQRQVSVPVLGTRCASRRNLFCREHSPTNSPVATFDGFLEETSQHQCDYMILAVPDDALDAYFKDLSNRDRPASTLCHLSGARGAASFSGQKGSMTVSSFHPLASLRGNGPIPEETLVGIQANDPSTFNQLEFLATRLGLTPAQILPNKNTNYHLAATMTANLSIALLEDAIELMVEAGIEPALAQKSLGHLLESVFNELGSGKSLGELLTGPIARGDLKTVRSHVEALDSSERQKQIYQLLSLRLLEMTGDKNDGHTEIKRLLTEEK